MKSGEGGGAFPEDGGEKEGERGGGWPMQGLESDHVISGPMRGLKIDFTKRGQHSHTHTDVATTSVTETVTNSICF